MIRNIFRIFRGEYLIGLWVGCIANLLLWFDPVCSPSIPVILLTLFYAGIFYLGGFLADSLWDADLEITYANEKRELASTVKSFGILQLRILLAIIVLVSAILSILLGWWIRSNVPTILFIVGLITGIGYATPPLRLKERGFLLHATSLAISAFFLPTFLLVGILQGGFTCKILLIGIGYSIAHYAMEIGNQLKDQVFDTQFQLHTLPFSNVRSNVAVALVLLLTGLAVILVMLNDYFDFSIYDFLIVGLILLLAHIRPLGVFGKTLLGQYTLHDFIHLNYASWQTFSVVGLLVIAVIVRLQLVP